MNINIMSNYWIFVLPLLAAGAIVVGLVDKTDRFEKTIITPLGVAYGAVCGLISCIMLAVESFNGFLALIAPTEEAGTLEDGFTVLAFMGAVSVVFGAFATVVAGVSKITSNRTALAHAVVVTLTTSSDDISVKQQNFEFDETAGSCGGPGVGQTLRAPDADGILMPKIPTSSRPQPKKLLFGKNNSTDDKPEEPRKWEKVKGVFGGGIFFHTEKLGPTKDPDLIAKVEATEDPTNQAQRATPPLCPGGENVKISVQDMCRIAKEAEEEFNGTKGWNKTVDAPIISDNNT